MLLKGAKKRSRRKAAYHLYPVITFTLCVNFILSVILLLCQIALRSYSPLEVHCTSLHYLHAAPFIHLYAGYACFRLCVPLLCVFQVCRFSWCGPLNACRWMRAVFATRKRVLNLRRDFVARWRRSQFYYNKNFLICQVMYFIYLAARVRCLSLFLLSYMFIGNFFLCFCLKFFGKKSHRGWKFKGRGKT